MRAETLAGFSSFVFFWAGGPARTNVTMGTLVNMAIGCYVAINQNRMRHAQQLAAEFGREISAWVSAWA